VVLFDGSISDFVLFTAIQQAYDSDPENHGRPIIIVAHSFSDAVVEKCLVHTKRGLPIIPVKAPNSSLPNSKTIFLNDLAALSGAKINDPTTAAAFDITDFGESELFKMNNFETFFQFNSDSDAIDKRVNELKALLETCFSEIDRSHVRANIAKISGGLSTIWVGGVTDAEIREKKDRVQDAIEAVRSAIAEGVVPGGGVTHIALSKAIEGAAGHKPSWKVLSDALVSPLAKILENCGESDLFDYVYDMVVKSSEGGRTPNVVYDAEMHELVNPFERGIIEPSKVLRVSIANSLSISSMLATLGGIIVNPSNPELEAQIEAASVAFKQTMGAAQED
jgi:chaperonin GroEL